LTIIFYPGLGISIIFLENVKIPTLCPLPPIPPAPLGLDIDIYFVHVGALSKAEIVHGNIEATNKA